MDKSRLQLTLKLLISAAVLIALSYIVDWREFARIASSARPDFLLIATALLFIQNFMIALRWQTLLATIGIPVTFFQALRSYLKGHFLAHFVPASVTADIVKAVDLNLSRAQGSASRGVEVASSILIERGFGAITVGIAVVIGLSVSPMVGRHAGTGQLLMLAAVGIIVCCVIVLFADRLLGLFPQRLLQRIPLLHKVVYRARTSIAQYRSRPYVLMYAMFLSFAIQAMRILPVYFVALAIGAGNEFFPYLIAVPIIMLINSVPVIGSRIGTEQGLFVLLLGTAGVNAEAALVIALVSLALGVIVALPGGYWWMKKQELRSA